jgi:internalin A
MIPRRRRDDFRSRASLATKKVRLNRDDLTASPESLGDLTAITSLDLSGNQLTVLPEWLGKLTALTDLDLRNNQLAVLPESLGDLTSLEKLILYQNRLTALPESLGNLTALTYLALEGNRLTVLPESLGNLTALSYLTLSDNRLTVLPESLGNLTALTRLFASGLDLSGDLLTVLPERLANLTALTKLVLTSNQLTAVPEWLGNLTALTTLSLSGNQLTAVPESLGNFPALTDLDLSRNQLTRVPESLGNLAALIELDLSRNQLTVLPESLGNLAALRRLDLRDNQLTLLPKTLGRPLTDGLILELDNNPLADPLPELAGRGATALATYLSSLEDAIALYEAKLLLVGEGNVGKTSLVASLTGNDFVSGRPTTHGIEISPIIFRHPSKSTDMTLRAWDFGGQTVYRVTHQFFFSRRALYVVVWHAREGREQNEVEGWLRRIRVRVGGDARIIVVATHCEERLADLDYKLLEQSFPDMLVGSFEVDNKSRAGIPELRTAIGIEAAELPQMGQLINPRWAAARNEILALASAKPQISYKQFVAICEHQGVASQEALTLAKLMHDLGHIIYYDDDEGLQDIVVLNPEWLTKAISHVLEDSATRDSAGVLAHARLKELWQEGAGYPSQYHPYFLRLMEKFDISYRLEDDELHSLVAQLVPHERPELPWQLHTHLPANIRSLSLICRLSEPAPGLIPWLTVRNHRASTGRHWRRGVFLRHPTAAYASEALLELRRPNELVMKVRAPSPDMYFNVLRDGIEDLVARRWPGLSYQLFIPCPGDTVSGSMCSGLFPLDGLLRLREHGHPTYPCIDCAQTHEISKLLTGFTAPARSLAAEVQQMHEQLARVEDGLIRIEGQAAETAESVRRVMRVVSTEVNDCPSLFSLTRQHPAGVMRLQFQRHHYKLTLWCEHPGYWHPWPRASYELDPPKEWFTKVAPYMLLVFKTLQLVVPLAGSIAVASLPTSQIESATAQLEMMKTLIDDLPSETPKDYLEIDPANTGSQLAPAEGAALRAIRAIIFEHDKIRAFGGLRRVQVPSGEFLWVCTKHHREYDPGLPIVP